MFNNSQTTKIDNIDYRILPMSGIITIWKLREYLGMGEYSMSREDKTKNNKMILETLVSNDIPVLKIGDNEAYWLIRLEDIKPY